MQRKLKVKSSIDLALEKEIVYMSAYAHKLVGTRRLRDSLETHEMC